MPQQSKFLAVATLLLISGLFLSACNAVEPVVEPFHSNVDVTAQATERLPESNALPHEDLNALNIDTTTATGAAWSPDESLVAVGYEDGRVNIFSAEDGDLLQEFADSDVAVASLAWSSDGVEVIVTDVDGEVSVYTVSQ